MDGSLVPVTHSLRDRAKWEGGAKQFHLTEYWVNAYVEGKYNQPNPFPVNSTLKSLRLVDRELGVDYAYTVWCTGEREIYDMTVSRCALLHFVQPRLTLRLTLGIPLALLQSDPDQMHNLATYLSTLHSSSPIARLHTRLDALLLVLKTCAGESCRLPWKALFTDGKVKNLKDAMKKEYDDYFKSLPDVRYSVSPLLLTFGGGLGAETDFPSTINRGARWATTGPSKRPSGRTPSPTRPRSLTPSAKLHAPSDQLPPSPFPLPILLSLLFQASHQAPKSRRCSKMLFS